MREKRDTYKRKATNAAVIVKLPRKLIRQWIQELVPS